MIKPIFRALIKPYLNLIAQELRQLRYIDDFDDRNLFVVRKAYQGFYISQTTGDMLSSGVHTASDWIRADNEQIYTLSAKSGNLRYPRVIFYDANKTYISGTINVTAQPSLQLETPANCKFIRFSSEWIYAGEGFYLCRGTSTTWQNSLEDLLSH